MPFVPRIMWPVLLALLALLAAPAARAQELRLWAGAGLRQPVEKLVERFSQQSGLKVYVDYGGSGQLVSRLLAAGRGDLFLPGSLHYIKQLKKRGLVVSTLPVALHTPVLAVARAQAGRVKRLADLALPGLRVGLGDPQAMAMGRQARQILERAGLASKVAPNVTVRAATVKQLALYVAQGLVDAAIIARADAVQQSQSMVMIPIPEGLYEPEVIAVALLTTSAQPGAARGLQEFLASQASRQVFAGFGFLPITP